MDSGECKDTLKMAPIGYLTPLDAMKNGPREEMLYVVAVQTQKGKSDFLVTVDVDPKSPRYCQIIHKLPTGYPNDELHHSGWNVCSSCFDHPCALTRDKLVLPSLLSSRIYIVDTGKTPKAPSMFKVLDAIEFNRSTFHTPHCLPTGEIMVSSLGDNDDNGLGDFVLIDAKTMTIKGTWTKGKCAKFGYDFWYQPYFDVLVSSQWGKPKVFKKGFNPCDMFNKEIYGTSLDIYSWSKKELQQTIDLGGDGVAPFETRFLHNPKKSEGFVGCAIGSNIFRFFLKCDGTWDAHKVIAVHPKKVTGWVMDSMNSCIADVLISLDDKFLYFSNWLHGDIRQYDITDTEHPKMTGQVFVGGLIFADSKIRVVEDLELTEQPEPVYVKGRRLHGGPNMLQLSLDGKRLYVSSSLFSPWDKQFYPEVVKHGGTIVKIDVDPVNGGMTLDQQFLVDFAAGDDGPLLPHEMRYPGGDCTSDIWLATD